MSREPGRRHLLAQLGHCVVAACLAGSCSGHSLAPKTSTEDTIRILSWNISGDPLGRQAHAFAALLRKADPDILVLDEVSPSFDLDHLGSVLAELDDQAPWQISMGQSGGRQRTVIASKQNQRALSALSSEIAYPAADRIAIESGMTPDASDNWEWNLDQGVPVSGAVIETGHRRLLVVGLDLQCCGDSTGSWQEMRRRLEAKEIRRRVRMALAEVPVDGIVIAGDFNVVGTALPLIILAGPYGEPPRSLSPAELYQLDGTTAWTWDGQGTQFDSFPMDFQLFDSHALGIQQGSVIDSRNLGKDELEALHIDVDQAHLVSDHRPLLVEYRWLH